MSSTKVLRCRICANRGFDQILKLGELAYSGRFTSKLEPIVPSGMLQLVRCPNCGLMQLEHDFELDELYRKNYGYRSGINQTMRTHLSGITAEISQVVGLKPGDRVVDIGSNDATLLKSYSVNGLERIGVDPTISQFKEFYPGEISTIEDFFDAELFQQAKGGKLASVVTSIAVIYDLPEPQRFFRGISDILANDGVWVFEQSYMPTMLELTSYDTICHEHLEYYALAQIDRLLTDNGLRMFDVSFNEINGGSCRVYSCHRNGRYKTTERLKKAFAEEKRKGLDEKGTYEDFASNVLSSAHELKCFLKQEVENGKSIYGYGASTKGNILLQFCGLSSDVITSIADRNPAKWGLKTPGSNIPIVSEKEVRNIKPDYLIVFPWHFRDEFLIREAEYLNSGGKFIFPLPKLSVVSKSGQINILK